MPGGSFRFVKERGENANMNGSCFLTYFHHTADLRINRDEGVNDL